MKKAVLGVKIDDVTVDQVVVTVKDWLSKSGKHYIVTPNPEIVMMAQKDLELRKILNQADLAIADGNGLRLATDIKSISPGIDVMEALVKEASEKGFTIGLLGGREGVAKEAAERLQKKYPKLTIRYALSGPVIPTNVGIYTDKDLWIPDQVRDDKVDLLFIAFGPPKQEKWTSQNLPKIPVKVVMVVGGSFDYLSGKVLRAPFWMRKLGLEWLFRLLTQPWRIKRQLALLKYLFLVVWKI